jgi:tRNA U55 pseudouridine synthase TruB
MLWLILRLRFKLGALTKTSMADLEDELLVGLSLEKLQALAEGMLASTAQAQLETLLKRNAENELSVEENLTLDRLLSQIDQLNVLKTRARYTLMQMNRASAVA